MPTTSTLSIGQTMMTVGAVLVLFLLSGVLIVFGRKLVPSSGSAAGPNNGNETGAGNETMAGTTSVIRSWIAVVLVGSVVVFSAVSFGLADSTLRNTLIGGLLASSGSAAAFYFASKASDQARSDILKATNTRPTVWVPDLRGLTVATARTLLAAAPLALQVDADVADTTLIKTQQPAPNSQQPCGTAVVVTAT